MKKLCFIGLLLALPGSLNAQPTWTTGSSNRTENVTQTVNRTTQIQVFGSEISTWEGSNISVAASAGISGGDAVFTVTDPTADWSLSITTRPNNQLIEQHDITDVITTTSVITSLSVFSQ